MKTLKPFLLTLLTVVLLTPAQVFACACCAERGEYFRHETDLDDYLVSQLNGIEFGSANLYTDAGYPDSITGINPLGDTYSIIGGLKGKSWQIQLTDEKARVAKLNLLRPEKAEVFGVDQDPVSESATVILYKELRFDFRVESGTGFLKGGVDSNTKYKLILQGRGNMCMNAGDFSTYILQVKGTTTSYSFFGKLNLVEDKVLQTRGEDRGIKAAN